MYVVSMKRANRWFRF